MILAHRESRVLPVRLVLLVLKALSELLVPRVLLVRPETRAPRDRKARLDQLVLPELRALPETLDLGDLSGLRARREQRVLPEILALLVLRV